MLVRGQSRLGGRRHGREEAGGAGKSQEGINKHAAAAAAAAAAADREHARLQWKGGQQAASPLSLWGLYVPPLLLLLQALLLLHWRRWLLRLPLPCLPLCQRWCWVCCAAGAGCWQQPLLAVKILYPDLFHPRKLLVPPPGGGAGGGGGGQLLSSFLAPCVPILALQGH